MKRNGNRWLKKFYKRFRKRWALPSHKFDPLLLSIRTPNLIHKLTPVNTLINTMPDGSKTLRLRRYELIRPTKLLENT